MRNFLTLLAALVLCGQGVQAQTMKVYQGRVITAIPAATASDILFEEGGSSFSVMGMDFKVSGVDQILFDRSVVPDSTLIVNYAPDGAWVTVSADIAPQMAITAKDGHVSALAAPTLLSEVRYVLSGKSSNGSFFMDGDYKSTVELKGLELTNPDSAAINIANGKRIKVVVPAGTDNRLADGTGGLQKACFFINGHAKFEGGGSLTLAGNSRHAYASDEYTQFTPSFGSLNVTSAVSDGLHVEQYFRMEGGKLSVAGTKGDCIDVGRTKDSTDVFNGQAIITGGSLNLQVASDDIKGLKTDSAMTISGGEIVADVSGLGTKGISVGTNLLLNNASGTVPNIRMTVSGATYMPQDPVLSSKCRGIKVKGDFTMDGGKMNFQVTSQDAKGISVDGNFIFISGHTNVLPESKKPKNAFALPVEKPVCFYNEN